jgi:NADPH:quinone reductase-like Zn-dependent oxidoreductase
MRAVRYHRFGGPDVLRVEDDVPEPVPRAGEIKVRVLAASLNPLDWKIRAGHLRLVPVLARPPRGTGCDFAGEIVAIGGATGERHVGEIVFGSLDPFGRQGACAEFLTIAASGVVPVPAGVAPEAAASLPVAGGTAMQALEDDARMRRGQSMLLTGAAGGVGHFAVQLARHLGVRVVAMCGPSNVEFVRGLGADEVVDYTTADLASRHDRFDLVFDAANALSLARCRSLMKPGALYLGTAGSTGAAIGTAIDGVLASLGGRVRARNFTLRQNAATWRRLAAHAAAGVLVPHVSARVDLAGVADAQARMQTGHGRGKIVVAPALQSFPDAIG